MKKRRDLRVKVTMPAVLRIQDGRRVTVRVDDVSANGLMVSTGAQQLEPGNFVEVLCRGRSIAAQIRWNQHGRSGLALARTIDIAAAARGEGLVMQENPALDQERRRDHSLRTMLDIAQAAENSRHLARLIQFGFAIAITLGSAAMVAHGVKSALSAGLEPVGQALSGHVRNSAPRPDVEQGFGDRGVASPAALPLLADWR